MVFDLDERKKLFFHKLLFIFHQICFFSSNMSVDIHRKMRVVSFSITVRGKVNAQIHCITD